MQNLSLQSPQNSALTKISALSANQDSSNNSANVDSGPAFKDVLSNQVRSQQSETKSSTKLQQEQSVAPGVSKATPPKQAQPADAKFAAKTEKSDTTDDSKTPVVQDIAGLSFEDLDTVNKLKRLAENADSSLNKSDTPIQQPLIADPAITALSAPVPANITPVDATHGVLAKDDKVVVGTSSGATPDTLEADATQKTGLSTKEQAGLAKSGDVNTKADLSDWIDSVLPNQAKQVDAALAATKPGMSTIHELAAKSVANPIVPNISATTALNPLSATQVASSNIINAYPGKTGWDQAISQKMVWMVGAGEQSATLTLNPPDLGPLQVVIHVHNDQADTTFISDNSDVRRALQDGLSNLKDMLSQSGINLGQANINSSQQEQQARQSSRDSNSSSQNSFTATEVNTAPAPVSRVSNGLVDTFA